MEKSPTQETGLFCVSDCSELPSVVQPCKYYMILGGRCAGKTVLTKALSNLLKPDRLTIFTCNENEFRASYNEPYINGIYDQISKKSAGFHDLIIFDKIDHRALNTPEMKKIIDNARFLETTLIFNSQYDTAPPELRANIDCVMYFPNKHLPSELQRMHSRYFQVQGLSLNMFRQIADLLKHHDCLVQVVDGQTMYIRSETIQKYSVSPLMSCLPRLNLSLKESKIDNLITRLSMLITEAVDIRNELKQYNLNL